VFLVIGFMVLETGKLDKLPNAAREVTEVFAIIFLSAYYVIRYNYIIIVIFVCLEPDLFVFVEIIFYIGCLIHDS
jgi:hypothetical protein